jgi:hypothetical protein
MIAAGAAMAFYGSIVRKAWQLGVFMIVAGIYLLWSRPYLFKKSPRDR